MKFGKHFAWMVIPGLLMLASQVGGVGYVARTYGHAEIVSFQTMLSLWAWTAVVSMGLDRRARLFSISLDGLADYKARWQTRFLMCSVAAVAVGWILGTHWQGGVWTWIAYCLGLVACSLSLAVRDWMYAEGEVLKVNKIISLGFFSAMVCMAALAWIHASFGLIALAWFAPHVFIWLRLALRKGLFLKTSGRSGVQKKILDSEDRSEVWYGLQSVGNVALSSIDVLIVGWLAGDQSVLLKYTIYSRLSFAAFMFSVNCSAIFVGQSVRLAGLAWRGVFFRCVGVHLIFGLLGMLVLGLMGPALIKLWLGETLMLSHSELGFMTMAVFFRSFCEAGSQTFAGKLHVVGAKVSFCCGVLGLLVFYLSIQAGLGAFEALALAWAFPSVGILGWSLKVGG